jgi:hypothetical protein
MSICRVKFKLNSITNDITGGTSLKLYPVTGGSEENKLFYKYTPYGEITLNAINENVASQFELGKDYFIDFTLAGE